MEAQLDAGAVGLTLPAGALSHARAVGALGAAARARWPPPAGRCSCTPGPSPWEPSPGAPSAEAWWPALTRYVAEMNAAWHSFVAVGPETLPPARVVFALLAGLAPLHLERLAVRGGPAERALDPRFLYDVSSYGPHAIEAVGRVVGAGQLVFGSDRPVDSPAPPAASPWTRIAATQRRRRCWPRHAARYSAPDVGSSGRPQHAPGRSRHEPPPRPAPPAPIPPAGRRLLRLVRKLPPTSRLRQAAARAGPSGLAARGLQPRRPGSWSSSPSSRTSSTAPRATWSRPASPSAATAGTPGYRAYVPRQREVWGTETPLRADRAHRPGGPGGGSRARADAGPGQRRAGHAGARGASATLRNGRVACRAGVPRPRRGSRRRRACEQ